MPPSRRHAALKMTMYQWGVTVQNLQIIIIHPAVLAPNIDAEDGSAFYVGLRYGYNK